MVNLSIGGIGDTKAALFQIANLLDEEIVEGIQEEFIDFERVIKATLQKGQGSGRIYKRKSGVHQASAPGKSPVSDSGRLAGSIDTEFLPNGATIGSNLVYAFYLEFGSRNTAVRPMWVPESERMIKSLVKRLEAKVAKVIK